MRVGTKNNAYRRDYSTVARIAHMDVAFNTHSYSEVASRRNTGSNRIARHLCPTHLIAITSPHTREHKHSRSEDRDARQSSAQAGNTLAYAKGSMGTPWRDGSYTCDIEQPVEACTVRCRRTKTDQNKRQQRESRERVSVTCLFTFPIDKVMWLQNNRYDKRQM